jgi:hypothetical protein
VRFSTGALAKSGGTQASEITVPTQDQQSRAPRQPAPGDLGTVGPIGNRPATAQQWQIGVGWSADEPR